MPLTFHISVVIGQLELAWTFPPFNTWQGQAALKANTTE